MGPLILIGVLVLGFLTGGVWGAIGAFILAVIVISILASAVASPQKEKRRNWGYTLEQKEESRPSKRIAASEWWSSIKLALKWNLYILGFLILLILTIFLFSLVSSKPPATPDSSIVMGEVWALDEIGDPAFKEYMLTTLWPQCPFYKPSGALYRQCLQEAADEAKAAYKGQDGAEIEASCQVLGSRFEGLLAGEMTLSCGAYRYSKKPL